MSFERIKFMRETSNGSGKYYAEAWGWWRDTRGGTQHAAPDVKGYGEGATPEDARSDAASSLRSNDFEQSKQVGAPQ